MIAEMHISSPLAAFDYRWQKDGNTILNFNLNLKTFKQVHSMHDDSIKLSRFCPNCFHFLSKSLLFSFMMEVEESFQINFGWVFYPSDWNGCKIEWTHFLHFLSYCSSWVMKRHAWTCLIKKGKLHSRVWWLMWGEVKYLFNFRLKPSIP